MKDKKKEIHHLLKKTTEIIYNLYPVSTNSATHYNIVIKTCLNKMCTTTNIFYSSMHTFTLTYGTKRGGVDNKQSLQNKDRQNSRSIITALSVLLASFSLDK